MTASHCAGRLARPTICFIALSLFFGPLTILLTPPFRGPHEPAHLMRAYGVATGELIRSSVDEQGSSGVFLPPRLDHEMQLFTCFHLHVQLVQLLLDGGVLLFHFFVALEQFERHVDKAVARTWIWLVSA